MSFTNVKNLENIGLQTICIDASGEDTENVGFKTIYKHIYLFFSDLRL